MAEPAIRVELSAAEALVLLDWLARFNRTRRVEFEDPAEELVLANLEALLAAVLAGSAGGDLLALARAQVRGG